MSIRYQVVKKRNPLKPNEPEKFYANAVYISKLTLRKIANQIAKETSLSGTDTLAVLDALTHVLPGYLLDSNIVNLGDFGSFRITIHATGADKEEEFTSANITGFKLHFRAGKEFSDQMAAIDAIKA